MHSLTNVPRAADKDRDIQVVVDGSDIRIVNAPARYVDALDTSTMTTIHLGDHMLLAERYDDLRNMIGRDIATAIRMGRDAGYRHAQMEIRDALGL